MVTVGDLCLQKVYGQDHIHRTLIGETGEQHDAVGDAIKSMRLLHLYNSLKDDPQKFDASMVSPAPSSKIPSELWLLACKLG